MVIEAIIFQSEVFGSICLNLEMTDILSLLSAFNRLTIDCSIPFFNAIDRIYQSLPGINPETIRVYRLIQSFGFRGAWFQLIDQGEDLSLLPIFLKMGMNVDEWLPLRYGNYQETALLIASKNGHFSFVSALLDAGANMNLRSLNYTALIYAIVKNYPTIVALLLEKGDDPNVALSDNITALILATEQGNVQIVSLLLNNPKMSTINEINKGGDSALTIAVYHGLDIVTDLINHGANIHQPYRDGESLLILAIRFKNKKVVDILLQRGLDANCRNLYGLTAIMIASKLGCISIIEILLNAGANINEIVIDRTNNITTTALREASIHCQVVTLRLLLEKGADPLAVDVTGQNILKQIQPRHYPPGIRKILRTRLGNW